MSKMNVHKMNARESHTKYTVNDLKLECHIETNFEKHILQFASNIGVILKVLVHIYVIRPYRICPAKSPRSQHINLD